MKIGVGLPACIPWVKSADVLEWARRADQGPFSSLGIIDRLVYSNYDPLITLAAAAGVTRRIRLMTTVLLAPLHSAALLAKQAASLDVISGGRLTLGLGVGAREDDFRAAGVPFKSRGRRIDAMLEQMKRIWNGQPSGPESGPVGPAPAREGGPEVLVGGYSPAAIQRAARLADGFITGGVADPAGAGQFFKAAAEGWKAAGRAGQPRLVSAIYVAIGEDPVGKGGEYLRDYYREMGGRVLAGLSTTPQVLLDKIHAFAGAGADELILWPAVADLDQLARITEVVAKA